MKKQLRKSVFETNSSSTHSICINSTGDYMIPEKIHFENDGCFGWDWDKQYMGDDGKYTFYIDLVDGTYAKNSVSHIRYPINGKTIDEMFQHISGQKSFK